MNNALIVTRHPGAVDWIRHAIGDQMAPVVAHLSQEFLVEAVRRYGALSQVIGIFPLHWLARLQSMGMQGWILEMDTPEHLRGQELTRQQLDAANARLVGYQLGQTLVWRASGHKLAGIPEPTHHRTCHNCGEIQETP